MKNLVTSHGKLPESNLYRAELHTNFEGSLNTTCALLDGPLEIDNIISQLHDIAVSLRLASGLLAAILLVYLVSHILKASDSSTRF